MSLYQAPKIVHPKQIKAARALLNMSQKELGQLLGVDPRMIRFMEKRVPTQTRKRLLLEGKLEAAGVACFASPYVGVRYVWPVVTIAAIVGDFLRALIDLQFGFLCTQMRARDRFRKLLSKYSNKYNKLVVASGGNLSLLFGHLMFKKCE